MISSNIVKINDKKDPMLMYNTQITFTLRYCFQAAIPFAVIGSNIVVEMNGKKIRGRQYPWGIVEGNAHHPTQI